MRIKDRKNRGVIPRFLLAALLVSVFRDDADEAEIFFSAAGELVQSTGRNICDGSCANGIVFPFKKENT